MSVLQALTDAIRDSSVEVIDLTAPLSAETPIIQLPEPFGNTARFGLTEISHYDERGPAWYWNDIVTGEHTGTHFDAPVHWVTGKDGEDVAQVPVSRLIAPAVGARLQRRGGRRTRTSSWRSSTSSSGRPSTGRCPRAAGCCTGPAGTRGLTTRPRSSTRTPPARTRRGSACPARCGWPQESPLIGLGTETVGTDAGAAHSFDPPFPCHSSLLGAGKYGLTQLQNLARLPVTGAVVIAGPLPIVSGSGSPCRALALVERS